MCRLLHYLGPQISISSLVTEPTHSIVKQSYDSWEGKEPFNGDGFGIAWYCQDHGMEPALFKDISPAWNNTNLHHIARVTQSECILAHVRAATAGLPVTQLNCHPFSYKNLTFMHNGSIGEFHKVRREIQNQFSDESYHHVLGSTDSEYLFGLIIDIYTQYIKCEASLEAMRLAMIKAIEIIEHIRIKNNSDEPSLLNLVLSDGIQSVVCRYASDIEKINSLYLNWGKRYICKEGTCYLYDVDSQAKSVLVASEPLSQDASWETVEPNTLFTINADKHIEHYRLSTQKMCGLA